MPSPSSAGSFSAPSAAAFSVKAAPAGSAFVFRIYYDGVTEEQLNGLSDEEKINQLKPYIGDDIEAISFRQYKNPRLMNIETILFVGEVKPLKASINYVYLRKDHALCLRAIIPQERYEKDMPKLLAITDSLLIRKTGQKP